LQSSTYKRRAKAGRPECRTRGATVPATDETWPWSTASMPIDEAIAYNSFRVLDHPKSICKQAF
jgi:hypothetical protein